MYSTQPIPSTPPRVTLNPLDLAHYVCGTEALIHDMDLVVESASDFSQYMRICAGIEKFRPTQEFATTMMDVTPAAGLWMAARTAKGGVVAVQAMRFDDLSGITLADFWNQHFARAYGGKLQPHHCPQAGLITGSVLYHGDLWIDPDARSKGLAGLFCRLAFGLALIKWRIDYCYGLIGESHAQAGLHTRYGYSNSQQKAVHWEIAPHDIDPRDQLIWMTALEFKYLIECELADSPRYRQSNKIGLSRPAPVPEQSILRTQAT